MENTTLGGALKGPGGSLVPLLCALGVSLGAVGFGYALGYSSPALPAMQGDIFRDLRCDDDDSEAVASELASLWSSMVNIGGVVGALSGGEFLERFGRKGTLLYVSAPLTFVGWAWTSVSSTPSEVIVARVVVGAGVGLASAAVPVFIAETSPAKLRGRLGSLNQAGVTFGILLVYAVGYALPHSRRDYDCGQHVKSIHPSGWRLLARIGAALALALFVVCAAYLPETPVWLATRDPAEAERARRRLRGGGGRVVDVEDLGRRLLLEDAQDQDESVSGGERDDDDDDFRAEDEHADDASSSSQTTQRQAPAPPPPPPQNDNNDQQEPAPLLGAADLVRILVGATKGVVSEDVVARTREPLRLTLALMVIQQFSGINAVIFYAGEILRSAGIRDRDFGGLVVMAVQFVVTLAACAFVDRAGRRTMLILALSMMIAGVTLMALAFAFALPSAAALVALVIYISGFSVGLGPIPWLLMSELLPKRARSVASAAATMLNWLASFAVTESYDYLVAAVTPAGAFFFFAAVCTLGLFYVSTSLPETKGLSLDQIEAFFADRGRQKQNKTKHCRRADDVLQLETTTTTPPPPSAASAW